MGLYIKCINIDMYKNGKVFCKINGEIINNEKDGCEMNYEESEYIESEEE